jgi:hypothetical protein
LNIEFQNATFSGYRRLKRGTLYKKKKTEEPLRKWRYVPYFIRGLRAKFQRVMERIPILLKPKQKPIFNSGTSTDSVSQEIIAERQTPAVLSVETESISISSEESSEMNFQSQSITENETTNNYSDDESTQEAILEDDIVIEILKERIESGILHYKVIFKTGDKGWIAGNTIPIYVLEKLKKKLSKEKN